MNIERRKIIPRILGKEIGSLIRRSKIYDTDRVCTSRLSYEYFALCMYLGKKMSVERYLASQVEGQ